MFSQIRYPVYIHFYNNRIICRQKLFRYIIFMIYQIYLGIIGIQPIRFLSTSDKMYFTNPRGKFLNPTKPIFKKAIVSESSFRYSILCVFLITRIFSKFSLPFWVIHINPCDYKIYIHFYMVFHLVLNQYFFYDYLACLKRLCVHK